MDVQKILTEAFLKCKPFDSNGRLISTSEYYVGKVLVSVCNRLKDRGNREAGSVEQLENFLKNS